MTQPTTNKPTKDTPLYTVRIYRDYTIRAPDMRNAITRAQAQFDDSLTTNALHLHKKGLLDGKTIFWSTIFDTECDKLPHLTRPIPIKEKK